MSERGENPLPDENNNTLDTQQPLPPLSKFGIKDWRNWFERKDIDPKNSDNKQND